MSKKVLAIAKEVLLDAVGVAGWVMVCRGVWIQWGPGYGYVAAGLPLLTLYVVREVFAARHKARQRAEG